jgi:hypothetical protein
METSAASPAVLPRVEGPCGTLGTKGAAAGFVAEITSVFWRKGAVGGGTGVGSGVGVINVIFKTGVAVTACATGGCRVGKSVGPVVGSAVGTKVGVGAVEHPMKQIIKPSHGQGNERATNILAASIARA